MNLQAIYYRLLGYKTIKELMAELSAGPRTKINEREIIRGRLLGKALLPRGLRYPKKGEVWEAIEDFKISYMTAHHAAYKGGGDAVLPRGERVTCKSEFEPPFEGAYFRAVRYDALQDQIVPQSEQENPYYDGYYFSIDTVDLNHHFKQIGRASCRERV